MRRSSATSAIEAAGESANARPSGAGHTSDGQSGQPQRSARRHRGGKAGCRPTGRASARAGSLVRLPEICFSVFVDRQAAAKAPAAIREEAEGAARRQRRTGVAHACPPKPWRRRMATDEAQAGACRHQACAKAGRRARGAHGTAGQGVRRTGACGRRCGRRRMAGEHAARASRLQNAPRTQRMGGEMGRVSQRTGGAG